jgi:RNA polymerase sigma-70 factor (ECF subfamily)
MQLKSPYKEVAYAHFCKELSVPEIAQQTGKNPKTVQTQLYRARAMLKKMLERGD